MKCSFYYRHPDDGVFDHFPKISKDSRKLVRMSHKRFRTFSENSEDARRFPKITDHFRGRLEDVSIVHQRIKKYSSEIIDILTSEDMQKTLLDSRISFV